MNPRMEQDGLKCKTSRRQFLAPRVTYSDFQLVQILQSQQLGNAIPSKNIHRFEIDPCRDPTEIMAEMGRSETEREELYFFWTSPKSDSKWTSRKRNGVSGVWRRGGGGIDIKHPKNAEIIGIRRRFHFYAKGSENASEIGPHSCIYSLHELITKEDYEREKVSRSLKTKPTPITCIYKLVPKLKHLEVTGMLPQHFSFPTSEPPCSAKVISGIFHDEALGAGPCYIGKRMPKIEPPAGVGANTLPGHAGLSHAEQWMWNFQPPDVSDLSNDDSSHDQQRILNVQPPAFGPCIWLSRGGHSHVYQTKPNINAEPRGAGTVGTDINWPPQVDQSCDEEWRTNFEPPGIAANIWSSHHKEFYFDIGQALDKLPENETSPLPMEVSDAAGNDPSSNFEQLNVGSSIGANLWSSNVEQPLHAGELLVKDLEIEQLEGKLFSLPMELLDAYENTLPSIFEQLNVGSCNAQSLDACEHMIQFSKPLESGTSGAESSLQKLWSFLDEENDTELHKRIDPQLLQYDVDASHRLLYGY